MSLATLFTLSRILIVPFVLLGLLSPHMEWRLTAAVLFAIASLTDFLDGWAARKYLQESDWGRIFDPVADKILVTSVLIALIPPGRIDPYMVIILLARDTVIGGLRSLAAAQQLIIAAKPTGKWKTALQMIAIPALIINEDLAWLPIVKIGFWTLWFSVLLSLISGVEYALFYRKASIQKRQA